MVQVHPGFDGLYYSPYLLGLKETYGGSALVFSKRGIPNFGHHGLAFRTKRGQNKMRVFISASDGPGINPDAFEWADIYAKVNLERARGTGPDTRKLLAIGPSFPVRLWNLRKTLAMSLGSFLACRGNVGGYRRHFSHYLAQYRYRLPEHRYTASKSDSDYVFFASRLWLKEPDTNHFRANFIRACRSIDDLRFEGGFVPRVAQDIDGFEDLTVNSSYSLEEYLQGIRRSLVVFNTPAVAGCHGWKLAEYLALGKAIITTALIRELPRPLEHGRHFHEVDGTETAIREAIQEIRGNDKYRTELEANARDYYDRYLKPSAVVERIVVSAMQYSDSDSVAGVMPT